MRRAKTRSLRQAIPPPDMPLRFLIADDNSAHQKLTANVVLFVGGESAFASNGVEALQMLEQEVFDVVLMDLWMPEMTGIYAASKMLAAYGEGVERPRILAVTGDKSEEREAMCRSVGMDGFITKPYEIKHLKQHLQQVVLRGYSWQDGASERTMELETFWNAVGHGEPGNVREFEVKAMDMQRRLHLLAEAGGELTTVIHEHAGVLEAFAKKFGFLRLSEAAASLAYWVHKNPSWSYEEMLHAEQQNFARTLTGAMESLRECRGLAHLMA